MVKNASLIIAFSACLLIGYVPEAGSGTAKSPIHLELSTPKKQYTLKEQISIKVRVYNCNHSLNAGQKCSDSNTVATRRGFLKRKWEKNIWFTAPDGTIVRTGRAAPGKEPLGTFRYYGLDDHYGKEAVIVELIPPGDIRRTGLADARGLYDFSMHGVWKAQVVAPLSIYDYQTDHVTNKSYGFMPAKALFNPLRSNTIIFEILPPKPIVMSAVEVHADHLAAGNGKNPVVENAPADKVAVRLYRVADLPTGMKPATRKTYLDIVRKSKPHRSGVTASKGISRFFVAQDNYVVIADYRKSRDFKYLAGFIDSKDPDWYSSKPVKVNLRPTIIKGKKGGD